MQRTIDILFVVGILVNLVKGADLILRPHQQKWLQDRWVSMTQRLDNIKPMDWFFQQDHIKKFFYVLFASSSALAYLTLILLVKKPLPWWLYLPALVFLITA